MLKTHQIPTERHIIKNVPNEPDETITTIRDKIEHFEKKIAKAYNELVDTTDTKIQQTEDHETLDLLEIERDSYINMLKQIDEKLTKLYNKAARYCESVLADRIKITELNEEKIPWMAEYVWVTPSAIGYGSRAGFEKTARVWDEKMRANERKLGETVTNRGTYVDMQSDRFFPEASDYH
jgi:hypothetical protein